MRNVLIALSLLVSTAAHAQSTIPGSGGAAVFVPGPLQLTQDTSFGSAYQNVPYSSNVRANGGTAPYTYTVSSGSLPSGINIGSCSSLAALTPCNFSGTPTGSGSSSFTVKATDSSNPAQTAFLTQTSINVASLNSITISPATPSVQTSQSIFPFMALCAWTSGVTDCSLNVTFSCIAGTAVCTGITFTTSNSQISFNASTNAGTVTAQAAFNSKTGTTVVTMAATTPTWVTTSLPNGQIGQAYSETSVGYQLFCSGGTAPYSFAAHIGFTLPAGLSLANAGQSADTNSLIKGTPTSSGTTAMEFDCTDSASHTTTSASMNLVVASVSSVAVTPAAPSIPIGGSQQFVATATFSDSSTANVSAGNGINFIGSQGCGTASSTSSTSLTCTGLNIPSGTSLLVGQMGCSGTGSESASTSDSDTVTFPDSSTQGPSGGVYFESALFYIVNPIANASKSITLTWGTSCAFQHANFAWYSGTAASTPNDQHGLGETNASTTLGNACGSGAFTTTQASELIVSTCTDGSTSRSFTPGTGYTVRSAQAGGQSALEDQIVSSIQTSVKSAFTFSGATDNHIGLTDTFKALASGTAWSSGTPAVASVGSSGLAQGLTSGTSLIQATYQGTSGSTTLTVQAPTDTQLIVSPPSTAVTLGGAQLFTAKGNNTGTDLTASSTWKSSDTTIATVTSNTATCSATKAGTVTITAQNGTLTGTASLTCQAGSSAKFYYNNNFEGGSISPCVAYNVNGGASVTIVTTQAHSGTHSAYMTNASTSLRCDPVPSGADPQRYSVDPNGLYWSFWAYTDATTINGILNCNNCGTNGSIYSQWKLYTSKTNLDVGGSGECPGSIVEGGLPVDTFHSDASGFVTTWDANCGGLNTSRLANVALTAAAWHHFQFYSIFNDTAATIHPVNGYNNNAPLSVAAGNGIALVYMDGTLIYNLTAAYLGGECTSGAPNPITQGTCQGPFYPNEKLSLLQGFYAYYTNPIPSIQVWIDDVCAADGPVCP